MLGLGWDGYTTAFGGLLTIGGSDSSAKISLGLISFLFLFPFFFARDITSLFLLLVCNGKLRMEVVLSEDRGNIIVISNFGRPAWNPYGYLVMGFNICTWSNPTSADHGTSLV